MFLPAEIITVLAHFAPVLTQRSYQKALVLLTGTILARGRRTVTSALRAVGLHQHRQWATYHHLLNRARWSGLTVSRLLLQLMVTTWLTTGASVALVTDETLERRWGRKIRKRGHWRDSLASSQGQNHKWSALAGAGAGGQVALEPPLLGLALCECVVNDPQSQSAIGPPP